VGSPRQDVELREYMRVRQDCERLGMPLVLWAYPRGRGIEAKGGRGSLYAQDYAARVSEELGADVVKLHEPTEPNDRVPEPYRALREDALTRLRRVVRSAGRVLVLFSGGEKDDREERVVEKVRLYVRAGAAGVMFGRNMWLRRLDDALALTRRVHAVLARPPRQG
jgi:class I fructose-bisphosphate aldolase